MLITQEVELKLGAKNIQWYKDKGYNIPYYWDKKHNKMSIKRGTAIFVKVKDLTKGSHARVEYECDYCGARILITYKDYLKTHDSKLGDCCHKCEGIKYKKTMQEKYGVDNSSQMEGIVEKIIATNQEKYGCDWQMQSPEIMQKSYQTTLERYGAERPLQHHTFLAKAMSTKCKNGTNPTSKPQKELGKILKNIYGNCDLEVPCDKCSLDCVVCVEGFYIDVEYDGAYWHQDKQKDRRRDNFVKTQGYKIFRIRGDKKDNLPSEEQIKEKISQLLIGYNFVEIIM